MKKTLAMLLALVMLFAMAACSSNTDNAPENTEPAAENTENTQQPNAPAVYTYEEDRGDFKVTWELTMYPNGIFYLNETHGLSGETTEHSGNTWRENDNGTISTGPWSNADVDKSDFFQPNGECTWIMNDDGTMEPTDHVAAGPGAGSYSYVESRGDFDINWTIILNEDGTFVLEEVHGLSGNLTTHTGKEWKDNGDGTFTTGAWDVDENKSEFFKPNGEATWKLNDDGTCEPVVEGGGESTESTGIAAGKYTYIESKGPGDFQWDILLMGNGNCRIDETNPSGETTEHVASGWTDNGDGTVTTGEWENSDVNKSDFFKPNGEATWKINADGTCEPVAEGEGGAAASAVNPGKYTFVDGDITWEVKVMGNGTGVVSELNTTTGEVIKEHTTRGSADGKGWVDNGDGTFETDEWEPEEREDNKPRLASPNGVVTWKVTGDGTCEPTEKKEEASSVAYGRYLYHDTTRDEYWAVMIMGNGTCTIQKVDAQGELIKINDEIMDYPTKGFRVNDDGTFTSFSMEDESNIPEFLSGGENGIATWKITDAENMIVEMVVE